MIPVEGVWTAANRMPRTCLRQSPHGFWGPACRRPPGLSSAASPAGCGPAGAPDAPQSVSLAQLRGIPMSDDGIKAVYERVSTDKQTTASQRHDLELWAKGQGGRIAFYADKASGKTMDRPGFNRLMAD